ncbi:hypothetical protein [Pedobacter mendelii]|uniref:Uncharacterized protein n=1 Tax=Pedobacter mendelii TaxID=1908240 RepID=A0ABQ2BPD9_9SPHI|nr:hypothetical protein [Pedobacter mendelii]GGI29468.1 hypothetical protein GCM10008119_37770 [Pedobacter mendelii]
MKTSHIIFSLAILHVLISCTPESGNGQKTIEIKKDNKASLATANAITINDEQEFRKLFKILTESLKRKNLSNIETLMNFPFYTSHAEASNNLGAATDPIGGNEFQKYKTTIFNADVMRLLPSCKEENLSEIDSKTDELYYKSLKKLTDPGSKMYEAYMQYPEKDTQAESYFGFIFGKVNGKFKALATYAKWPVK